MADLDWAKLLRDRPDVLAEFQQESSRDHKSKMNLSNQGVLTDEDFAKWWYNNYGANEGYTQTAAPVTPQTPAPNPNAPNPATPQGPGTGATTTPGGNRSVALQQARMRARMQLQAQGLNPDQYMSEIDSQLNDIYNIIPDSDNNAGSYFDPNFATDFIGGKNAQARTAARGMATNYFKSPLQYSSLDATISRLLGEGIQEGEKYLERGQKRGQFNEAGVEGGRTKLLSAKAKAQAKLKGYANDIFSKYDTQFGNLRDRALADASDTSVSDPFDLTRYTGEYDRLSSQVNGEALEGDLLNLMGDEPLINLQGLRGGVAQSQGTTNLKDLDVLEGLSKRKQASSGGRGLGSEGAF